MQIKRDASEAAKVFEVLSLKSGPVIWKNFLIVLSQLVPYGDSNMIEYSSKAVELFPDDKEIFSIKKLAVIGQEKINQAGAISRIGLDFFNQGRYIEAAMEFEKALKIDTLEYSYFENAASAFYMAGDYDKALFYSDRVINVFNPKTGKSEYINALAHLNIGGAQRACELLQQAISYGYTQAQATYDQRCN
jgi:tetratricopeptide (TPR) repeat protein